MTGPVFPFGPRVWLILAGASGAVFVALAAYEAHGLALDGQAASWIEKAQRFQAIHSLALLALAALPRRPFLSLAGLFFCLGILLFSGSLSVMALLGWPLRPMVPVGGSSFILGWLCLLLAGLFDRNLT